MVNDVKLEINNYVFVSRTLHCKIKETFIHLNKGIKGSEI